MKWMDRQNAKQMEMRLKFISFDKIFWTVTRMCYYILSISVVVTKKGGCRGKNLGGGGDGKKKCLKASPRRCYYPHRSRDSVFSVCRIKKKYIFFSSYSRYHGGFTSNLNTFLKSWTDKLPKYHWSVTIFSYNNIMLLGISFFL